MRKYFFVIDQLCLQSDVIPQTTFVSARFDLMINKFVKNPIFSELLYRHSNELFRIVSTKSLLIPLPLHANRRAAKLTPPNRLGYEPQQMKNK